MIWKILLLVQGSNAVRTLNRAFDSIRFDVRSVTRTGPEVRFRVRENCRRTGLNWTSATLASTGLACLLLPGGQTAHSMFKIPIDSLDADSICNIPKQSLRADLLQQTNAIIYDECLMTHKHCFEALDRTLQDLRNCQKPFGNITMVFGGDFQQILPVILHGSIRKSSFTYGSLHRPI